MKPGSIRPFEGWYSRTRTEEDRGAHRDVHQKTTGVESPSGDEGPGNGGLHDHPHRPAGGSATALRAVPAAMPEGPQHAKEEGVAGSIDAEVAIEAALLAAPGGVPAVRVTSGGFSVGRALGTSDDGVVQYGSETGAGAELAGDGSPVWAELEERSDDCEAGGAVRVEAPDAAASTSDWHR